MAQENAIVLVTEKEYAKGTDAFEAAEGLDVRPAPCEEEALAAAVAEAGCRAVVLGVDAYSGPLYDALAANGTPALMARFGVGHDGVDKVLAQEKGIVVTNTPGVLDQSVAELTFWLLGAVMRSVCSLDAEMRRGEFAAPPAGGELAGRRMLVLGFGGIGRRVARIAKHGFGMRVVASGRRSLHDLALSESAPPEDVLSHFAIDSYTTDPRAELPEADVVSVHLASTDATRHFVDAEFLAAMREDAVLLNTSRGAVVDEAALYDALKAGSIRGAGLDVYEQEPYVPVDADKDLRMLDNVVLTPHVGSNTREANARMAAACVENLTCFFAGAMEKLMRVG